MCADATVGALRVEATVAVVGEADVDTECDDECGCVRDDECDEVGRSVTFNATSEVPLTFAVVVVRVAVEVAVVVATVVVAAVFVVVRVGATVAVCWVVVATVFAGEAIVRGEIEVIG